MLIYVNLLNFLFSGFLFSLVRAVVTEGMASLIASNLLRAFSAVTIMNMTHHNIYYRYIVTVPVCYGSLMILTDIEISCESLFQHSILIHYIIQASLSSGPILF